MMLGTKLGLPLLGLKHEGHNKPPMPTPFFQYYQLALLLSLVTL